MHTKQRNLRAIHTEEVSSLSHGLMFRQFSTDGAGASRVSRAEKSVAYMVVACA